MKSIRVITATVLLELVIAAAPQSGMTLDAARQHFNAGRFKEAGAIYSSLAVTSPSVVEVHTGLIQTRLEMNDVAGALKASADAINALPDSAAVIAAAGDVQYRITRLPQALALYERALQREAKLGRAWWGIGRIERITSMRKSAREHFEKAHALSPDDPDVVREWAYTLDTPEKVAAGLQRYMELASFRPAASLNAIGNEIRINKHLSLQKACSLASPQLRTQIKLKRGRPNDLLPNVFPLSFRISAALGRAKAEDFGFTRGVRIALFPEYAKKVGITRIADVTPNSTKSFLGIADSLKVGAIEFKNCVVDVDDGPRLSTNAQAAGSLGINVFADFLMSFDFPKATLTLNPLQALSGQDNSDWADRDATVDRKGFEPIVQIANQPGITVRANSSQPMFFLIDFASNASVISSELGYRLLHLERPTGNTVTYSGACSFNCVSLEFAGQQVRTQLIPVDLTSASYTAGVEIDGILGTDVLTQFVVSLDLRNGFVKFDKPR